LKQVLAVEPPLSEANGETGEVKFKSDGSKCITVKALKEYGTDPDTRGFVLENNHSFETASLVNEAESLTIVLATAFKKQGVQLNYEPVMLLECPDRLLPSSIGRATAVPAAASARSTGEEPPKKTRRGGMVAAVPPGGV
jgi:hypothetical protein